MRGRERPPPLPKSIEQMHPNDDNRYRRRHRRRPGTGDRLLPSGASMRTALIVLVLVLSSQHTSPRTGLWEAATISAAVCAAAAAPQTSSDQEGDAAGGGGGNSVGASAIDGAGAGAGANQGETVTSGGTTAPPDTTTDMTDNDSATASTSATTSTTSAGSESTVQESSALGLFRQIQEKFQQMLHQSPQNLQTQTETAQEQLARAQKLKEEQLRKQQQRWSMGLTNPSINIGPGLPRKSRRRVLYESSIRSHYVEKAERDYDNNGGSDDVGEMTSSDRERRPKIDARKTIAALTLGGKGEVVWESGNDVSSSASIDAESKLGVDRARSHARVDRKMDGCAYYSPEFGVKKNKNQDRLPYWNYRICPGRSIEQFHAELRKKMTIEELGQILEEDAQNQRKGESSKGTKERTSTTEHTNIGATIQYISLGKQIAATLSPNSSILSDEYHQQAKLWKDDTRSGSGGSREGFDEGRGRLVKVSLSSYGQADSMAEVSYYAGGAPCGKKTNPAERVTRLVTLEGCCPESDSMPPPLFKYETSKLRIMSVAEPRMCRYNILACFTCPREEQTGQKKVEDAANSGDNVKEAAVISQNVGETRQKNSPSQREGASVLPGIDIGIDRMQRPVTSCDGFCHEATESYTRRMPSESLGFDKASSNRQAQASDSVASSAFPPFPQSKAQANLDVLRQMFQRSYDSYMYNAYPTGELKPISCKPGTFDLIRLPALTLIDSLDTMVIMRNFTEFARSVERLRALDDMMQEEFGRVFPNFVEPLGLPERNGGLFGVNQNVSLFETNIRVLGGLLSAHQLAEAFIPKDSIAAHDVWDENGDIWMGSSLSPRGIAAETPADTQPGPPDDDDASCPSDDRPENQSPPCTDVDYVQDIGRCKKVNKKQNATTKKAAETIPADAPSSIPMWKYDGFLLTLAHDLGIRLLTAFSTETGIPYGTVNLLYGIPPGETSVASLAGGGTLSIEMELLSRLTGDLRFGQAARLATRALWGRRSNNFDLLGKHIDVHSGQWRESLSGIGSNSDSFYEYLIKHHILFPDDKDYYDLWTMFRTSYSGVFYDNRLGDWYGDVDMMGGRQSGIKQVFESLMAFWPGMQVLLGELNPAARSTNAFSLVREFLGLLPERFNFGEWRVDGGGGVSPLRPELLESIYFLHMATLGLNANGHNAKNNTTDQSPSTGWQWASDFALSTLDQWTRTDCPAYATVKAVDHRTTGSVMANFLQSTSNEPMRKKKTGSSHAHLNDDMPSYFLSETIKYLFLTFEGNKNILNQDHQRDWVFTTEAHPVHHVPLPTTKVVSSARQTEDDTAEVQEGDLLRVLDLLAIKLAPSEEAEEGVEEVSSEIPSANLKPQQRNEITLNEEGNKWTPQTSFAVFNQVISAVNNIIASNREALHQQGASQNVSIWTFDHEHHLTPHVAARSSFWPNAALIDEAVVDNELQVENLSTVTTYRLGRGDGSTLSQTCPNLHHPDLRWVTALNGESLDYGEGFVTFMSDVFTSAADMESRSALALSSAASHGTEYSLVPPSRSSISSCRAIKPQPTQEAATKEKSAVPEDSHNEQIQERELEITRFDMGAPLGPFDVAVLTQEVGFYVKHVASSNSIEATIFDDPAGGPTGVMVVADIPPPKPKHEEVDHHPSIQAGRRCHWNAHLSHRDKVVIPASTTNADSGESMPKAVPYQRRKTLFASSDSEMSFRCTVELVQSLSSNEPAIGEVNTTMAMIPCSPALFGPTNITILAESGGISFEGSLLPPESSDPSGCKETPKASTEDPGLSTEVEMSKEATIQLVRRGKCRFQTKIANQVRRGLGHSGVIVINTDPSIFVMSGGCLQGDETCEREDAEGSHIPSVMVGQGDGVRMMSIAEDVHRKGGRLHATVSLLPQQALGTNDKDVPPIFNTESTKTAELPTVSMSSAAVQIYAPGGWGIHAVKRVSSATGEGAEQQEQEGKTDTQEDTGEEDTRKNDDGNGGGYAEEPQKSEWQLFILQHQSS